MKLFQTEIKFPCHKIKGGSIKVIDWSIEFASKFPNKIRERKQLQRFLGSLNYIAGFYNNSLKKGHYTGAVRKMKFKSKQVHCLPLSNSNYFKIVETYAADIGYGGILK